MAEKFLLVGGGGFLGRSFAKRMAQLQLGRCKSVDKADVDVATGSKQLAELFESRPGWHVLLLASEVGAKLFSESPVEAWIQNSRMLVNMVEAVQTAGSRLASVSWFSTSETYGSSIKPIKPSKTKPDIDWKQARSLYAQCKLAGETAFIELHKRGCVNKLRIFKPFNVFGAEQRRGVVWSMVKSALEEGTVRYSDKTDRTLTPASYFADAVYESLTSSEPFASVDIAKPEYSVTMKLLAETVVQALELWDYAPRGKLRLEAMPPDAAIQHRHVGRVHRLRCPEELLDDLTSTVAALATEIRDNG